jgi:hypothetical protein
MHKNAGCGVLEENLNYQTKGIGIKNILYNRM